MAHVVVLPLVPVTPTNFKSRDGKPQKAAATGPRAWRTEGTTTCGTGSSRTCSHRRATAPRASASAAKSWPSERLPLMQAKSAPGCARPETISTSLTIGSASTVAPALARARPDHGTGPTQPGRDQQVSEVHARSRQASPTLMARA